MSQNRNFGEMHYEYFSGHLWDLFVTVDYNLVTGFKTLFYTKQHVIPARIKGS